MGTERDSYLSFHSLEIVSYPRLQTLVASESSVLSIDRSIDRQRVMEEIDEAIAPPKAEKEEGFRPYYPENAEDEGFLTELGLKKKLLRLGEGWLVPEPGDEITGISISRPFLSSILYLGLSIFSLFMLLYA